MLTVLTTAWVCTFLVVLACKDAGTKSTTSEGQHNVSNDMLMTFSWHMRFTGFPVCSMLLPRQSLPCLRSLASQKDFENRYSRTLTDWSWMNENKQRFEAWGVMRSDWQWLTVIHWLHWMLFWCQQLHPFGTWSNPIDLVTYLNKYMHVVCMHRNITNMKNLQTLHYIHTCQYVYIYNCITYIWLCRKTRKPATQQAQRTVADSQGVRWGEKGSMLSPEAFARS